jgi:DNA polymerase I-like protein with 3'-5' exonuclease and polymerase domains
LSAAFQKGLDIISAFRKKPDPSLVKRFTIEGDIHRVNTVTFGMAKSPELVTDDIRGAVKGIAFGAVYGRSMKSLAAALKMPLEDVENIFKLFFSKLKNAAQWLLDIEKYAQSKQFVASGLNRRRNLFGLMLYRTLKENKSLNRGVTRTTTERVKNSSQRLVLLQGAVQHKAEKVTSAVQTRRDELLGLRVLLNIQQPLRSVLQL